MKYIFIALGSFMLLAQPCFAEKLYRWVDADERAHYTDSPYLIPENSRSGVFELTKDEETGEITVEKYEVPDKSYVDKEKASIQTDSTSRLRSPSRNFDRTDFRERNNGRILRNQIIGKTSDEQEQSLMDILEDEVIFIDNENDGQAEQGYGGRSPYNPHLTSLKTAPQRDLTDIIRSVPNGYETLELTTKDFRYFPYFVRLKRSIESVWQYPLESRLDGEQGKLSVLITVNSRGVVEDVRLLNPSPFKRLNDEALRAVMAASPFTKFPYNWGVKGLNIRAVLIYKLEQWWKKRDMNKIVLRAKQPTFEVIRADILDNLELTAVVNDVRLDVK